MTGIFYLMVSDRRLTLGRYTQAKIVVYDESFLLPDGTPSEAPGTGSELWVIDAKRMHEGMNAVVTRVKLPQRVPYG